MIKFGEHRDLAAAGSATLLQRSRQERPRLRAKGINPEIGDESRASGAAQVAGLGANSAVNREGDLIVTTRLRDSELLFQRLEASRPSLRNPDMEEAAARAMERWSLLGLLAPRAEAAARSMPNEIGSGSDGTVRIVRFAVAGADSETESSPLTDEQMSPLDQLFARLDRAAAAKLGPLFPKSSSGGPASDRPKALRVTEAATTSGEESRLPDRMDDEARIELFENMARP
ncbi:MAG: hypothetical protein ACREFD_16255 [Stellaceae bacterium]